MKESQLPTILKVQHELSAILFYLLKGKRYQYWGGRMVQWCWVNFQITSASLMRLE